MSQDGTTIRTTYPLVTAGATDEKKKRVDDVNETRWLLWQRPLLPRLDPAFDVLSHVTGKHKPRLSFIRFHGDV
jgi:hypothetical protein